MTYEEFLAQIPVDELNFLGKDLPTKVAFENHVKTISLAQKKGCSPHHMLHSLEGIKFFWMLEEKNYVSFECANDGDFLFSGILKGSPFISEVVSIEAGLELVLKYLKK